MKQKLTERQKTYLYKLHGLKLDHYEVLDDTFSKNEFYRGFMRYLIVCIFLASCGNTVNIPKKIKTKTEASGEVNVNHNFNISIEAFREACELEHKDVVPQEVKDTLIKECQAKRLKDFLDTISNLQKQAEEENN